MIDRIQVSKGAMHLLYTRYWHINLITVTISGMGASASRRMKVYLTILINYVTVNLQIFNTNIRKLRSQERRS